MLTLLAFWYFTKSPFGHTLVAIKQNEVRVRHLGLNSDSFVLVALLVAGAYAGLAGALYAISILFTFPLELDWHQSGDFFLMTVLGGAGTVWGPLLGALIYVIGKEIHFDDHAGVADISRRHLHCVRHRFSARDSR